MAVAERLHEAEEANTMGMNELRNGNARSAAMILARAYEQLTEGELSAVCREEEERRLLLRAEADTLSNLGVCNRQLDNIPCAVEFFQRALRLLKGELLSDPRAEVSVHLNLSSCYADAGAPAQALEHAQAAVDLGGHFIIGHGQSFHDSGEKPSLPQAGSSTTPGDDYAMMAVAYHKVAEAKERMKDWGGACFAYSQSYEVVRWSFGPNHRLTKAFQASTRCPRKTRVPDAGTIGRWGDVKPQKRRLPGIPPRCGGGGRGRPAAPVIEPADYTLGPDRFLAWPPSKTSEEEELWYSFAAQTAAEDRNRVISELAGAAGDRAGLAELKR